MSETGSIRSGRRGRGLCWLLLVAAAAGMLAAGARAEILERLIARGDHGDRVFLVEIADEPHEMQEGLMWRRELAEDHGMLFLYPAPTETSFWMRNTYVSLDIVFIDPEGQVLRVASNTRPLNDTSIPSGGEVVAVLEIGAGLAERYGIRPGTEILHRRLPR